MVRCDSRQLTTPISRVDLRIILGRPAFKFLIPGGILKLSEKQMQALDAIEFD